jgi:hypothetical protein
MEDYRMDRCDLSRSRKRCVIQTQTCKIAILYLLVIAVCFSLGILLAKGLQNDTYTAIYQKIYRHFKIPFGEIVGLRSFISLILKYTLIDLCAALLLFLFSCSILNHNISEVILGFCGLKAGFITCLLTHLMHSPFRSYISPLLCTVHLLCSLLIVLLFWRYSYRLFRISISIDRKSSSVWSLSAFSCLIKQWLWILLIKMIYCALIFYL